MRLGPVIGKRMACIEVSRLGKNASTGLPGRLAPTSIQRVSLLPKAQSNDPKKPPRWSDSNENVQF
jgi:hypothetical protein